MTFALHHVSEYLNNYILKFNTSIRPPSVRGNVFAYVTHNEISLCVDT